MTSVGHQKRLRLRISSCPCVNSLEFFLLTCLFIALINFTLLRVYPTSRVPVIQTLKTYAKDFIQDIGHYSNVLLKEGIDYRSQGHGLQNTEHIQSRRNLNSITNHEVVIREKTPRMINTSNEKNVTLTEVNIFGNSILNDDKRRKQSCQSCFKHDFNYVIQNDNICQTVFYGQAIDLLILITKTHQNIEARGALRVTWLSHSKNNTANIRYVFMLGETEDVKDRSAIKEENDNFHDILKEDFVDSYENLTYKTIMGFKWASMKCINAKYVMKTDDDMFVNVPNLIQTLSGSLKYKLNSTVIGSCPMIANPIRNRKSKWYASVDSYPENEYPGFCSGTGYVSSLYVVTKVYEISPNIPFFHLEDVYVSLCINKLGFHLESVKGFHIDRPKIDPCVYHGEQLITSQCYEMSPKMIRQVWQQRCMKPN